MSDKGIDEFMLGHCPDLDRLVLGGRDHLGTVRVEIDTTNGRGMSLKVRAAAFDIINPETNSLVS
jgi:hypothetical protein